MVTIGKPIGIYWNTSMYHGHHFLQLTPRDPQSAIVGSLPNHFPIRAHDETSLASRAAIHGSTSTVAWTKNQWWMCFLVHSDSPRIWTINVWKTD